MTQTNKDQEQIRAFILGEIEKRTVMLGENKSAVEKIVTGKQSLVDSGVFDSLSFLELLTAIEDEFNVKIDLTGYDLEYFVTLKGLILVTIEAESKDTTKETAKIVSSKSASGVSLEELTPQHPCWHELVPMFESLYEVMERFNLMIKLKPNGAELWLKSLENVVGRTSFVIGAVDNGKLVGYSHSVIKILPTYLEGNHIGEILSIYVTHEYRNRKIAHKLIKRTEKWLEGKQVSSIEAKTMTRNKASINFWNKCGFKNELLQIRKMNG